MNGESGYLRVIVSTGDGALPVKGARVTVRGEDGEERVLTTDESGLTERIELPAPARVQSLDALSPTPFARYSVTVEKDGFYLQRTGDVPIFSGISARQPINLIGISEYNSDTLNPRDNTSTVMRDPQVLSGGDA